MVFLDSNSPKKYTINKLNGYTASQKIYKLIIQSFLQSIKTHDGTNSHIRFSGVIQIMQNPNDSDAGA
jgi:hypothetical protein